MSKFSVDKGKRYERKIAGILSEWSGIELVRTPDGAPEDLYADIWPKHTTVHFPLAVECKHVEGWSFDQIIQGTGAFYTWLEQAEVQAHNAKSELLNWYSPFLVFTKNRYPNMVCIDDFLIGRLAAQQHDLRCALGKPLLHIQTMQTRLYPIMGGVQEPSEYVVLTLDNFRFAVSYEMLQKASTFYWCAD